MDTGSLPKPLPGVTPPPLRGDLAPVRESVRTELPQAVQASASSEQVRFNRSERARQQAEREEALRGRIDRGFHTDRQTGELVYRAIDEVTGAVIVQSPEQAVMRLRAYLSTVEARSEDRSEDQSKVG